MRSGISMILAVAWLAIVVGCEQPAAPTPSADSKSPPAAASAPAETAGSTAAAPSAEVVEVNMGDMPPAAFARMIEARRGHVVLVDFWATWCVPCRRDFPHTVEMYKKYHDQGLEVIAISMDDPNEVESRTAAREFLQEQGAGSLTNYICTEGMSDTALMTLGIEGGAIPHYKVFGRDGQLVKKFGAGDPSQTFKPEDIEAAIKEALAKK